MNYNYVVLLFVFMLIAPDVSDNVGINNMTIIVMYLHTVVQIDTGVKPADVAMRNLLYSMLCAEGSYKSQKV